MSAQEVKREPTAILSVLWVEMGPCNEARASFFKFLPYYFKQMEGHDHEKNGTWNDLGRWDDRYDRNGFRSDQPDSGASQ
jgi:hypothetical protein